MDQDHALSYSDLTGINYQVVLRWFHEFLSPSSYFEIGTLKGTTLAIATCASVAVDPAFQLAGQNFVGSKPLCSLHQVTSDAFFEKQDPTAILGRPIDLAFLDGMHRCEFLLRDFANTERHCRRNSVIVLHDCLPVEAPIAERTRFDPPLQPHRSGWWAGDVWRTVAALKHFRPDLEILALDAAPTGLVCVTNLNPKSSELTERYFDVVKYMLSLTFANGGMQSYLDSVGVSSTSVIDTSEKMTEYFWL